MPKLKMGQQFHYKSLFYRISNSRENYSFVTSLSKGEFSSSHYLFIQLVSKGKGSNIHLQLKASNTKRAVLPMAKDQSCRFRVCLSHIM